MNKKITVGSDFSGVGAFDQALMRLNVKHKTIFACDMDKHARQTYIHNYGEPKYYPLNVYDREIPIDPLTFYMTSPPCQAFSLAGKRLGKNDKRGILFFNSHEFISKNKPKYFIFENVKGLLSDDDGITFQEWINLLGGKSVNGLPVLFPHEESVSYHIYWKVINAKHHGIPQNRERVFIVGIRDDEDNNFTWPIEEHLTKRLKDVLEDDVDDKYFLSKELTDKICYTEDGSFKIKSANLNGYEIAREGDSINFAIPNSKTRRGRVGKQMSQTLCTASNQGVIQLNPSLESGGKQPYQQNRVYNSEALCPALNAGQMTWGGNIVTLPYNYKIRRLTPRECFRLMDFPDTFTWPVSDNQAYKQAGNSIVVRVLEKIIKNLLHL